MIEINQEEAERTALRAFVHQLAALEEIRRLKASYFRFLDTKDWDGFERVFAADAVMDMRQSTSDPWSEDLPIAPDWILTGAGEIRRALEQAMNVTMTVHQGYMPEIHIDSPTRASGVWAMTDLVRWPAEADSGAYLPSGAPIRSIVGYGHYHDTYACIEGNWRIQSTRLTRLRIEFS